MSDIELDSPAEDAQNSASWRPIFIAIGIVAALLIGAGLWVLTRPPKQGIHDIARREQVGRLALAVQNDAGLRDSYARRVANPANGSIDADDANVTLAGAKLPVINEGQVAEARAVLEQTGKKPLVLVIDSANGSDVANRWLAVQYLEAAKRIDKPVAYAAVNLAGRLVLYRQNGSVELRSTGGLRNAYELLRAMPDRIEPTDAVVLVTDRIGLGWPGNIGKAAQAATLGPVTVENTGARYDPKLLELTIATDGRYRGTLPAQTATQFPSQTGAGMRLRPASD